MLRSISDIRVPIKIKISKIQLLQKDLTNKIIEAYYDVYNILGFGFLEKVYQNAMFLELRERGFYVEAQKQIKVNFNLFLWASIMLTFSSTKK